MSIGNRKYFFEHFSQNFGFFDLLTQKTDFFGAQGARKARLQNTEISVVKRLRAAVNSEDN